MIHLFWSSTRRKIKITTMKQHCFLIAIILLSIQYPISSCEGGSLNNNQIYVIHVVEKPDHVGSHREWHESFLPPSNASRGGAQVLYSFRHILNGFAATLTDDDLEAMRKMDGFVHAQPNRAIPLATTHSPSFLGLYPTANSFWSSAAGYGKGVIIGMLDTGISPTHPSFDDQGMPPPPPKWKGKCEFNASFCNNKLIGARTFNLTEHGSKNNTLSPPIDDDGHGTHTAGTAAGRFVRNASVLGSAFGVAAGMAPDAHLAIYKVCGPESCHTVDIFAAVETAIEDGVDVLSISIAISDEYVPLDDDPIAIATFGAIEKGVFVSCGAGNDGPYSSSVQNAAPWILTVGASTTDRRIRAVVRLGNGTELVGESAYQPTNFSSTTFFPLVYPQSDDDENATACSNVETLKRIGVEGKVVLCKYSLITNEERGRNVKEAGGTAMIVTSTAVSGFETKADANVIPASFVSNLDGKIIQNYINSTWEDPTATIIFEGTVIGGSIDPAVTPFSARGPSETIPGLVKPDIIGPGMNVLAAWHEPVGPFEEVTLPPFNMISGTSMSCPHLSGIAALLKSAHPDWTPAMIKSAIVTTADMTNVNGEPILELYKLDPASFYVMGAGQVNTVKASNPGLVYDTPIEDYIPYLCGLGYSNSQVKVIAKSNVDCSNVTKLHSTDLNYPSMVVDLDVSNNFSRLVYRTVTNVGEPSSTYGIQVVRPPGIAVTIVPDTLVFSSVGQSLTFSVTVSLDKTSLPQPSCRDLDGYFTWVTVDQSITVRSPLVVKVC